MKGTVAERMMHKMATKCQMAMKGCVSAAKGAVAPFDGKFTPDDGKYTNRPVKIGAKAPRAGTFCPVDDEDSIDKEPQPEVLAFDATISSTYLTSKYLAAPN